MVLRYATATIPERRDFATEAASPIEVNRFPRIIKLMMASGKASATFGILFPLKAIYVWLSRRYKRECGLVYKPAARRILSFAAKAAYSRRRIPADYDAKWECRVLL